MKKLLGLLSFLAFAAMLLMDAPFAVGQIHVDSPGNSGSGGTGAVNSVNGKAGDVVLSYADVNADISGAATTAANGAAAASVPLTQKGAANGVASLDATGKVPASVLPTFTSSAAGAVPASGGGTANFMRADGTWATPPGSAGVASINSTAGAFTFTGAGVSCAGTTCTFTGSGSGIASIVWSLPSFLNASPSTLSASGTQTFSLATQSANAVFAGPSTGSAAAPTFRALVAADLPTFSSSAGGAVPSSGGGTTNFLRADGTWAAPSGGGTNPSSTGVPYWSGSAWSVATPAQLSSALADTTKNSYLTFQQATGGSDAGVPTPTASKGFIVWQANKIQASINGDAYDDLARKGDIPWACEPGRGDGVNAIEAATYPLTTCYNTSGRTVTITSIKCFADTGSSTMNVTNGSGTALLTAAVTCSSSFAAGTQSATVTLAAGDHLKFTFVADGTTKQATYVVGGHL